MSNFYFIFKPGHKNYGGWVRVIAVNWRQAMAEYEHYNGRDYLNFFEESLFKKQDYPKGELNLI